MILQLSRERLMKLLLSLFFAVGLSACGLVYIGPVSNLDGKPVSHMEGINNDHNRLDTQQLKLIKQFSLGETDAVRDQKNNLSLVEITGADISESLEKYPYCIVYLWDVNCPGEHCKPLYYYEDIEKKFRDKGVKLFMISETYQYDMIKGNAERSAFDRDLYVLKDSVYGHKLAKSRMRFYNEMTSGKGSKKDLYRYFIFKKNNLIYYGSDMSEQLVDSVLNRS